ncbi:MAG: apolipoprotein N-acyltransferase [Gemmatimonadetes bacterium]|nr:apolipoprotein N-acyltransferase [Gemmatimonadota bacterium]
MDSIRRLHASSTIAGYGLACCSALFIFLSIPKVDWWPLAWGAFVPVMIALHDAGRNGSLTRVALIALLFAFVSGVAKVYWIRETVMNFGGLNLALGLVSMAGVALVIALYAFIFGLYAARADWKSPLFPLFAAALWTALEYIQTYVFTGFPWELLGYSQHLVLPVIQIANFTGVYGVSFLVMLLNATLAMVFIGLRDSTSWRAPVFAMFLACITLIGTTGYGWWSISQARALERQTPPVKVAVVQGSKEQGMKWLPEEVQRTVDVYRDLTRSILPQDPEFIVFPETAMTFWLESPAYEEYNEQVHALTDEAGVPLLTGALGYRSGENDIYNSAFLLLPQRGIVSSYSKMHLVPFGEYLPIPSLFSFLSGLTGAIGDLTPGDELTVMPLTGQDMHIGTVICYESIFPDLVRRFPLNGANVLVVMTNDAWFGTSSAPSQHFSMAVLRAVETGTPIIRAANTGISGFISATGAVYGTTPMMVATTTVANVHPNRGEPTFYTRYGDVFALFCCVLAVVAAALTGGRTVALFTNKSK